MATAPSPNDLTRQQLDELDALLQRMLALPLNTPDGAAPGPPAAPLPLPPEVPAARNWRVDPPAPTPAPAPHVVPVVPEAHSPRVSEPAPAPWVPPQPATPPEPVRVAPPVSRTPPPDPEPIPPQPARSPVPEPPLASVLPPPVPERKPAPPAKPAAVIPQPAPPPVPTPTPPSAPAIPGPPVPVGLWPFVALNWTIDRLLGLFGPPGWFLRSTFGKYLLGLAGVGLLAYTAVHLAEQYGWVSLPVPLPWPR